MKNLIPHWHGESYLCSSLSSSARSPLTFICHHKSSLSLTSQCRTIVTIIRNGLSKPSLLHSTSLPPKLPTRLLRLRAGLALSRTLYPLCCTGALHQQFCTFPDQVSLPSIRASSVQGIGGRYHLSLTRKSLSYPIGPSPRNFGATPSVRSAGSQGRAVLGCSGHGTLGAKGSSSSTLSTLALDRKDPDIEAMDTTERLRSLRELMKREGIDVYSKS